MNQEKFRKFIENHIRNNSFKTKEDLYRYLLSLRTKNINYIITDEDIKELLKLYDELHIQIEVPLEMKNYTNKKLDDKNYIVSEEADRVLKTTENSQEFIQEFKNTQNEILAHSKDGDTNAKEVFNKIADTKKEEITLIPLSEAVIKQDIDTELLYKINFFISKSKLNPYSFKIDTETGVFFNIETNELYEVRKNENTNQYEIFADGEIRYDNTNNLEDNDETLENDHEEELQYSESIEKQNVKVRKLVKDRHPGNAAFAKVGLLLLNLVSFTIIGLSIYILLSNK